MKLTIETDFLTIIVQLFQGKLHKFSYALITNRLSGDTSRLTIPELCETLDKAALMK
jgi:hypothetical protein